MPERRLLSLSGALYKLFPLIFVLLSASCAEKLLRPLPPPQGGLHGRICDKSTGEWVSGATVTLGEEEVQSDEEGFYAFEGVQGGEYVVRVDSSDYSSERIVVIGSDGVLDISQDTCLQDLGAIEGRICDEDSESWVAAASVEVLAGDTSYTTTSDELGRFMLEDVPVGAREVVVGNGEFSESYEIEVQADTTVWAGDIGCGPSGNLSGRICGGEGYWLSGAQVYVELEDGTKIEAETDGDGYFTLSDVPSGTYIIQVVKGSYATEFEATIVGNDTVELEQPLCIPPTTRIAVVTGIFDSVEDVLTGLGFQIRATYNTLTPTIGTPMGNVDIIKGEGSYGGAFWISDFLADPLWLTDYDIIFFNCGLELTTLSNGGTVVDNAMQNLNDFVQNGGSVYASDWASEVVRLAFPEQIDFVGDDSAFGEARVGDAAAAQSGLVVDENLAAALNKSDVVINFDLSVWAVAEPLEQQPSTLEPMVLGDVAINYGSMQKINVPLLSWFAMGEGKVLFTSFHNESQNSEDLTDILNYMVFEL